MPHLHRRGNALQGLAQHARKVPVLQLQLRLKLRLQLRLKLKFKFKIHRQRRRVCAAGLSAAGEACLAQARPPARPCFPSPPPGSARFLPARRLRLPAEKPALGGAGGRRSRRPARAWPCFLDGTPGRWMEKGERDEPGRRAGAEAALAPERRRRQAPGSPSRAPCRDEAAGRGRRLRRKRARIAHGKNGDNATDCGYVFPCGGRVAGRRPCRLAAGGANSPKLPAEAAATSTHPGAE